MIFVDTNYFLRFLLNDIDEQHQEAKQLLAAGATGKSELFSSVIVFFEIYWVLTSFYGKKKEEILATLKDLLKMTFIKWENGEVLEKVIKLYQNNAIDLEDSYNLIYAKIDMAKSFKTFDKKLIKMAGRLRISTPGVE